MASAIVAKKLPSIALKDEQPAVGLIDVKSLAGAYEFATAARSDGIQPIVGCDFETEHGFITLISQNANGWKNLLTITRAQAKNAQRIVSDEVICGNNDGLILLAGGPESALERRLSSGRVEANEWLKLYMPVFGERMFIEINRLTGRRQSEAVLDRISHAYNLPLVGTSTAAYGKKTDYDTLELLNAIDQKRNIDDPALVRSEIGQHFKTQEQLRELFEDAPHLLENAARIALACSDDGAPSGQKPMLPRYPDANGEEDAMMREMAKKGIETRIADVPEQHKQQYYDRLELEMDIICSQGFSGYFLIVADFINWSKQNDIPVGPGRGSGAGSAVAWALGITDLDPIRWGLLFERFINPDRVSLPDFDVDFCQTRRDETIEYVRQKYGDDKVVAIGTHGSWGARSAFKDAARSLGIPNGAAHYASQMLSFKDNFSISETNPEASGYLPDEAREHFRSNPQLQRALEMAEPLQGFVRQHGRHAAGIIIADPDVGDVVPVMRDPGGDDDLVTQYDMKGVENCGLVKFDFLGLKTSTIIKEAVDHVRRLDPENADLDILNIPFEDDKVFEMLNHGDCHGIFQLESEGMVRSLKQVRPNCFEDIVAIISLYRPGPMENIASFANRKNGLEPVQVPHPKLKRLLQETQGIIVYQEQVMRAAQLLAGYTLAEADLLRRAMGKKIPAEMEAQRGRFVDGATKPLINVETMAGKLFSMKPENELDLADGGGKMTADKALEAGKDVMIDGTKVTIKRITQASCAKVTEKKAEELFDLIDKFSGYGFNKSHAAAYALLTWQSSWLKLYHPAAFYSAALTYNDSDFDKMRKIVREARDRGVEFLPPSVEKSDFHFTPEVTEDGKPAVRWGLSSIKGVGMYAGPMARNCRHKGFTTIEQVASAMKAQGNATGPIRALAAAGAFEHINKNRNAAADHMIQCVKFEIEQTGQDLLFSLTAPACPDIPDMTVEQKREAEINAIGISFHDHPLANVWSEIRRLSAQTLAKIEEFAGCGSLTVLVRVEGISKSVRGSTTYAKISDATAEIEAVVEELPPIGDLIIAQVARKTVEKKWRLVSWEPFIKEQTPRRMRVEIKASHDWEKLRNQLIASGQGNDRIDIMIDLGDKKVRRVLPACFVIDDKIEAVLAANEDVTETRIY